MKQSSVLKNQFGLAVIALSLSGITTAHAEFYAGLGGGAAEFNSDLFGYEFESNHGIATGEVGYLWKTASKAPWFIGPALNVTYYAAVEEDEEDGEDDGHPVIIRGDLVMGKYFNNVLSAHVRLGAVTDQYFDGAAPSVGAGIGINFNENFKLVPEAIIFGNSFSSVTNYTLMLQYHF